LPRQNPLAKMNREARAVVTVLTALLVYACENPFQTRTPEPPTQPRGIFITPRTPEAVIINLRNAVVEQNLVNYSACLADPRLGGTFRYQADPAVGISRPELFANWGLEEEKRYFSQLSAVLPPDSARALIFTAKSITTLGDSAIFIEDYQLNVNHTQQAAGIARSYAGQARFLLREGSFGLWSIHRWEDLSTGSTPTWSALKASFGQ